MPVKKLHMILLMLAICLLAIGAGYYIGFQQATPQPQPIIYYG
jgi:hypothetical protein